EMVDVVRLWRGRTLGRQHAQPQAVGLARQLGAGGAQAQDAERLAADDARRNRVPAAFVLRSPEVRQLLSQGEQQRDAEVGKGRTMDARRAGDLEGRCLDE